VPTVLETTDLDLAHHVLCNAYGRLDLADVRGDVHVRLSRDSLGRAEIHRNAFTMRFDVSGTQLGVIGIGRIAAGAVSFRVGRQERQHRARGEVFLAAQPEQPYHVTLDAADLEFAVLQPELLAQVAAAAPGRSARPLQFISCEPVSAAAAAIWNNAFDFVRDNVVNMPIEDATLMESSAARLLAAAALSVFPNNSAHEPTIEDRHDAHPATLRRAVSFIDGNAQRDICATDIAAASHVTIRTLQLAFRRYLGTTPMAYLRRVRLEHAHQELLLADPATVTVGAIAARWGIIGHSRFTYLYRSAYGVTPSSTLNSRPG
jgi:AraC-like DNA-binding protein